MIATLKRVFKAVLNPITVKFPKEPSPAPEGFRGKIEYDREKCIGCGLCVRFCPSNCIHMKENKKIRINLTECTFCATCEEVCPVKCIKLSNNYDMVTIDRKSKELIVE